MPEGDSYSQPALGTPKYICANAMKRIRTHIVIVVAAFAGSAARADDQSVESDAEGIRYFETHIRPLLAEHCHSCHGAKKQESSLRLDTFNGLMRGGDSGPAVVAKDVKQSLLLTAVSYDNADLQMPPKKKLSKANIAKN